MAKVKLSEGGFTLIPKGKHIFKIIKSDYDETFGKIEIEMVTSKGQKHIERFTLVDNFGEMNEKALNAYSYFAKTALNNFNLDEIDTDDLVGCYLECTVEHEEVPSNKDPAKMFTFIKLTDKTAASGFEKNSADVNELKPEPKADKKASSKGLTDLDALLG